MKRLLLMGTALLSIASYASAMNRNQQNNIRSQTSSGIDSINSIPTSISSDFSSSENTINSITPPSINNNNAPLPPEEIEAKKIEIHERWNNEIVPAVLNKDMSFNEFETLYRQFKEDWDKYLYYGYSWNYTILNNGIRDILNKTCDDLKELDDDLVGKTESEEINAFINKNTKIKEDLNIFNKLFLAGSDYCLPPLSTEGDEANETIKSLFNLASCISQIKTEQLRNRFTQNNFIYNFLYTMSRKLSLHYEVDQQPPTLDFIPVRQAKKPYGLSFFIPSLTLENIITLLPSSLYSKEDGFNALTVAILLPHLKDKALMITKNTNQAIISDLIKGVINYSIDIIKNPDELKIETRYCSMLDKILLNLKKALPGGSTTTAWMNSFDGKESVIDMINRKRKDPNLSERFKNALKEVQEYISSAYKRRFPS